MEWLSEADYLTESDDDFYVESGEDDPDTEDLLNGELFLIFSNQEAMEQLVSLWRRYT